MPSKPRMSHMAVCFAIWAFALCAAPEISQAETGVPTRLVAGTIELPPFAMQTASGDWEGLSIELLQAVARDLNTELVLREFSRADKLEKALTTGTVDLTAVTAVTADLEFFVDFSNPYYRSGSAIAVKMTGGGNKLLRLAEQLFSITALKVMASLGLLWMMAGFLVWLFERRRGFEMFSDKCLPGLGNGIWWAAVTMTTVGYGDKAPKTVGGRVVAIIWMFASIMVISSFTATMATTLTVDQLSGKVKGFGDLPHVRVGTLAQSQFFEHLADHGIAATPFKNIPAGLQALTTDKIDAFVHDEATLKHLIKASHPGTLQVLPETFRHYYVCMALPTGSELREPLNRALLKVMNRETWRVLLKRYLG